VSGVIKSYLPGAAGGLSEAGGQAASDLQQLKNIIYSKAFQSTGSRRTQQEVTRLSDALSQLDNANLTPAQLKAQLQNIQKMTREAHANVYGAAGQPAPEDYYNVMDPIYKPEGGAGGKPGDLFSGATKGGKGGFGGVKTYNPVTGMIE
jgi:hypothetical protein